MGTNVVSLNGKISNPKEALIPATDRGFLYGDAIFETLRIYKGFPFQLSSHLKRLEFSASHLEINIDTQKIKDDLSKLIKSNKCKDGVIRITVSGGATKQRSLIEEGLQPNILIQSFDLPQYPESYFTNGVNAITMQDNRNELCHIKSTNLMPSIIGKKQAREKDAFEAIMISKRGFITEGSTSNVFGLIDETLITPPVSKKVLNGTTRQLMIKIARELGIRVEEDALMGNEIPIVSELFITNSVIEVLSVTNVDSNDIGNGQIGSVTSKLAKSYKTVISNWLNKQNTTIS